MQLPPFRLERLFAAHEFSVRHLLSPSDCETLSVAELLDLEPGARDELLGLGLGYTESRGAPALRAAIAALYDRVEADGVLVFSGAEEAIFAALNVLIEPDRGDEAVVHGPAYQSLHEVARAAGARIRPWRGDEDRGWRLDPRALEDLLAPSTRVVVINAPHNPTGHLPTADVFNAMVEAVERHGRSQDERPVRLFSDEVYRGLELDPSRRLPAACDLSPRALSLGVVSKTYGLPGLRIGWIATRDRDLLARLEAFKDYLTICASAPSEVLARVALHHHEHLAARCRAIVAANLDHADAFFASRPDGFRWRRPEAGSVAYPRLLGDRSATEIHRHALETEGVLVLPGTVFEPDDDRHLRLGLGRRNFPDALAAFGRALDRR